ncbi:hypothetical protein HPB51_019034 [Rhipicephalus microplus]|uniref:Tick transposon n=1 Tax=Rhipicephalus microplus TaxID=6941 RepID=A0A9J6D6L5_RHIMP|nr:hypothetical protein HPB51_019034 [Rhipicephalus microplus]
MYCYGVPLKCVLYKKQYEVCYLCGQLGHRSDVRISYHVRCRGCGMTAPPEDHACEPKCKLCGKGHLTADRKCNEAFRTPYTIKKRQWEAWRRMEREERKAKDAYPQTCRMEEIKERSRSRSKHRRGSRGRTGSFPRLPERQEGELPPMTGPVNEGTSGSAVLNSGRPTSPNRKVGWGDRASQDKRDEEMLTIKEENRMLKEQLAMMSRQIEELQLAIKSSITSPVSLPRMPQNQNIKRPEDQSATPPPAKKRPKEAEKPVIHENVETVIDMLNRQVYPRADNSLSKKNEVLWRKLQTGVFPNPALCSKWHPAVLQSQCKFCDEVANFVHMVWTCPRQNDGSHTVESWEALLCSPLPNVQRDIISQALAAAASQEIPADSKG